MEVSSGLDADAEYIVNQIVVNRPNQNQIYDEWRCMDIINYIKAKQEENR